MQQRQAVLTCLYAKLPCSTSVLLVKTSLSLPLLLLDTADGAASLNGHGVPRLPMFADKSASCLRSCIMPQSQMICEVSGARPKHNTCLSQQTQGGLHLFLQHGLVSQSFLELISYLLTSCLAGDHLLLQILQLLLQLLYLSAQASPLYQVSCSGAPGEMYSKHRFAP